MADTKGPAKPGLMQSGADILVQCLVNHGVETVFAYPGGASMPIHQALTRVQRQLRTILPRHEQGGGFAAEGYARSTGKVGVCVATSGPGATNFVTCLADAKMDSVPIVAITGQVGTPVIGTDAFQETPIVEVCRAITKHHYLVTRTEDIPRVVKEAFHIASTGRPGPVIIDVPKDVQNRADRARLRSADEPARLPARTAGPARPELEAGPRAGPPEPQADHLRRRRHHRLRGGRRTCKAFAEKTGIPVALTLHGLGGFPSEHFLCLQMLGMHGTVYANYAINEADLLLALGVRFDDRVTGKVSEFAKHGKIVHIDIDPSEINKNKVAHVPIVGDVQPGAGRTWWRCSTEDAERVPPAAGSFADWLRADRATGARTSRCATHDRDDAILAQYAIDRLWQILQGPRPARRHHRHHRRRPAPDVGGPVLAFQQRRAPGSPAAASARWASACPRPWAPRRRIRCKTVIDIDGDGSFLMNIQELA